MATFAALTVLYSVIAFLRIRVKRRLWNGQRRPRQRSWAADPLGGATTLRRKRKKRLPVRRSKPHLLCTVESMRGVTSGPLIGGGLMSTGRVALVAFPTASVAVTVTSNAPAEPKAWLTAEPAPVWPSPKLHAYAIGDIRSVAAAAIPIAAPGSPEDGTLTAVRVGPAASRLAPWNW